MKLLRRNLLDPDTKQDSGIILYTDQTTENECKIFAESTVQQGMELTISYPLETNVIFEKDSQGSSKIRLVPYERKFIGIGIPKEKNKEWQPLQYEYEYELIEIDKNYYQQEELKNQQELETLLLQTNGFQWNHQSYTIQDITQLCKEHQVKFIDSEFPPQSKALYGNLEAKKEYIIWRRPEEFIIGGKIELFHEKIEPNDIRQGALGDCWFLCAIASLAEFPQFIQELFSEQHQEHEYGVYSVRFCKNGMWQQVIIDDYIPCAPGAGPIYASAHDEELWVLLLEKAYAKLHGSYAQLRMGWAYEAMMDMTGAPTCSFRFEDDNIQNQLQTGQLWSKLLEYDEQGYLMSASTPGEDTWTEQGEKPDENQNGGLVAGHAYSLLAVKETSTGAKLVQLRNPWGSFEWTGDWSDSSPLWTDMLKEERKTWNVAHSDSNTKEDGLFWMSFDDMTTFFYSINVCFVRHPCVGSKSPWHEIRRKNTFLFPLDTKDSDGDGNTNERVVETSLFQLKVPQTTTMHLGIHQADERILTATPNIDIGLTILCKTGNTYRLIDSTGNSAERQVQMEIQLDAGDYLIVPTTTGCKFANLLSSTDSSTKKPVVSNDEFTKELITALKEIHCRLDSDMDGVLSKMELQSILKTMEHSNCIMPDDVFQWLMETFDSTSTGLTATGFIECYKFMYEKAGTIDVIWKDLIRMGYNEQLELVRAKGVIISIHSVEPLSLTPVPFDASIYEEAIELPILQNGTMQTLTQDGALLNYTP